MASIINVILVNCLLLTTAFSVCPNGWMRHDASCYLFSHDLADWPGATVMCSLMEGYLVEIDDINESTFLGQQARLNNDSYWIALSDASEEGSWRWMVKKEPVSYTNWAPGQPDNSAKNENCADLWPTGQWNDGQCFVPHHYICEISDEEGGIGIIG